MPRIKMLNAPKLPGEEHRPPIRLTHNRVWMTCQQLRTLRELVKEQP